MIETNFFILTPEQYQETVQDAAIEGVSIDYYLLEFCSVEGDWVIVENWDFLNCILTNINDTQKSNIQITW